MFLHFHVFWHICVFVIALFLCSPFLQMEVFGAIDGHSIKLLANGAERAALYGNFFGANYTNVQTSQKYTSSFTVVFTRLTLFMICVCSEETLLNVTWNTHKPHKEGLINKYAHIRLNVSLLESNMLHRTKITCMLCHGWRSLIII